MIVSLNTIKKYVDINVSVDELAELIGARLVEIEEVIDIGAKYKGIVIARVVNVKPLEGSDHLSVVKLDDGGVIKDIARDQNNLVQVVCGAPNVRDGIMVAWLAPGVVVPETYSTNNPLVIESRKLRGVMSDGMIASARELDLYDDHEGILEIDNDIAAGADFANAFELDDYLLDIENKSLTHRPDCFGLIGFAREVAAILGQAFITPKQFLDINPVIEAKINQSIKLDVGIKNPDICARYQAIAMTGVDATKKSPLIIQTYLSRMGVRPINAIIDVTNYLMMLVGQPLHTFDYDKLVDFCGGADIAVRLAKAGERLELLDGRIIDFSTDDILITAGDKPIALAGAMGGRATEVDGNTKNIIIESATFNLYNLRSTQMRHGIFSEAITRFTKGQSPAQTAPTLSESVKLIKEWAGGEVASDVKDDYPGKITQSRIELEAARVNDLLGSNYTNQQIISTLKNVEFDVKANDNIILATAPYWRGDIHIPEDVIEEIGRINGFDNIEPTLAGRDFTPAMPTDYDAYRKKLRKILVRAGANEVLTYSFVHGDLMIKAGLDPKNSYRIVNSISPNLQYYRQTLIPSLLSQVHPNIKQGYNDFVLFEINKVHQKCDGMASEKVPIERESLSLIFASNQEGDAAYYYSKRILDYVCRLLGIELDYVVQEQEQNPINLPFEKYRSASVIDRRSKQVLGIVGEFSKRVARNFKLPKRVAGFEIDNETLFRIANESKFNYTPISHFPYSERDICFRSDEKVEYAKIEDCIRRSLMSSGLEFELSPIDIYMPKDSMQKNVTFRIRLTSHEKTLSGADVSRVISDVVEKVESDLDISVV